MKHIDLPLHSLRPGYYLLYDVTSSGRYIYIFEADVAVENIHILSRTASSSFDNKVRLTNYDEPMVLSRKRFPAGANTTSAIYKLTDDEFLIQLAEFI